MSSESTADLAREDNWQIAHPPWKVASMLSGARSACAAALRWGAAPSKRRRERTKVKQCLHFCCLSLCAGVDCFTSERTCRQLHKACTEELILHFMALLCCAKSPHLSDHLNSLLTSNLAHKSLRQTSFRLGSVNVWQKRSEPDRSVTLCAYLLQVTSQVQ